MDRARLFGCEMQTQRAQTGPGVKDDQITGLGAELDARCVAAGANGVRSRCRERAATPPDVRAHSAGSRAIPEDRHAADDVVCPREKWERGDFDRALS